MDGIFDGNTKVDCYVACGDMMLDFGKDTKAFLAHGLVTGQGDWAGIKIGHAWIELDGNVIDPAYDVVMPIEEYYELGDVRWLMRYTYKGMALEMEETGTYGPWDGKFAFYASKTANPHEPFDSVTNTDGFLMLDIDYLRKVNDGIDVGWQESYLYSYATHDGRVYDIYMDGDGHYHAYDVRHDNGVEVVPNFHPYDVARQYEEYDEYDFKDLEALIEWLEHGAGFERAAKTAAGHCYQDCVNMMWELGSGTDALLVHGLPMGRGAIEGIRHGHAWIELNGMVIDPSYNITMPIDEYYEMGDIQYTVKYTWRQMAQKIVDTGVYGPWDSEFDKYAKENIMAGVDELKLSDFEVERSEPEWDADCDGESYFGGCTRYTYIFQDGSIVEITDYDAVEGIVEKHYDLYSWSYSVPSYYVEIDEPRSISVTVYGKNGDEVLYDYGFDTPQEALDAFKRWAAENGFNAEKTAKVVKRSQMYSWDDEEYDDLEREYEREYHLNELSDEAYARAVDDFAYSDMAYDMANDGLEEDFMSLGYFFDSINIKVQRNHNYTWFFLTVSFDGDGDYIHSIPEGKSDGLYIAEGMLEEWSAARPELLKLLDEVNKIDDEYKGDAYSWDGYDDWSERYWDAKAALLSAYEEVAQSIADNAEAEMKAEYDAIISGDNGDLLKDIAYDWAFDAEGNVLHY